VALSCARQSAEQSWVQSFPAGLPEPYPTYISFEGEASALLNYECLFVPGLLQTEEYARQVNSGYRRIAAMPPSKMERRIQARLLRQQVLTRDRPLELSVVIDESALLRELADPPVMRAQLERLVEASQMPNVTVRVLPMRGAHPVIIGSFVVLEFGEARETTLPDVVYTEHLRGGLYFEEETDTYQYRESYLRFLEASLSPADSAELISDVARRVWS
jgi:hypothetical protein